MKYGFEAVSRQSWKPPAHVRSSHYLTDELNQLKQKGTYFRLRVLDDEQAPVCHFDGRKVINLASNNYLGLTTHPKLREAALEATRKYGVGSGAVRTIAGTMRIHMELEETIARFKNVEACVVFQSGFTANAGTVSSILGKDDYIISDELNHASIIDGCRLSRAKILVFRHKDVAHAEEQLASVARTSPATSCSSPTACSPWMATSARCPDCATLAEKYGAIMMVDDAHASGVLGRNGRGTVDHFGVHGRVDIQVGTLSKAIGALGGYVCGTRDLIEYLYHRARPFLFSTSHPPSVAATCIAAFDVLEQEPELHRATVGRTRASSSRNSDCSASTSAASTLRLQRNPDHADHHRRRPRHHGVQQSALRRGRHGHRHCLPHRSRRQSPRAHHRHRHPHSRRTRARRWRCSSA